MKIHKMDHAKRFQYHSQVYCRKWKCDEAANIERWRGVNCKECLRAKPKRSPR